MISGAIKYILTLIIITAGILGDQNGLIEPELGIPLFLKIITYDENFEPDNINAVKIWIVYDHALEQSYEQLRGIKKYFKANPGLTVCGVTVEYYAVTYDSIAAAWQTLDTSQYHLMIATCIGNDKAVYLASLAQTYHVRSFTLNPDYVPLGLSIGVKIKSVGQLILVNLDSSRREGSRFSAHLLKLCEIVKG